MHATRLLSGRRPCTAPYLPADIYRICGVQTVTIRAGSHRKFGMPLPAGKVAASKKSLYGHSRYAKGFSAAVLSDRSTEPFGIMDFDLLAEERAWRAAVGDVQVISRTGQRDEEQAPFPLQVLRVRDRVLGRVGQRRRRGHDPVRHTDHGDRLELEALHAVHGADA